MESRPSILKALAANCCTGCGACSVATNGAFQLGRDASGAMIAVPDIGSAPTATLVCPFTDETESETEVAARKYPELAEHDVLGRYGYLGVGRVTSDEYLLDSSSGGLTSWFLAKLLALNVVDAVIHVGESADADALFAYCVSDTQASTADAARRKSMYYSVSFAEVFENLRGDERRFAFVGVPCFVTAIEHLRRQGQLPVDVVMTVGLVCGHLKSAAFAEYLAAQVGVTSSQLDTVDFRHKVVGRPANAYEFGARSSSGWAFETTTALVGGDWGQGLFQLKACDYCDDIFAESADVVFGDAWLDKYVTDWRGTNIVLARSKRAEEILIAGMRDSEIFLEPVGKEEILRSQGGNIRHRRLGLSVRLSDDDRAKKWHPKKRVRPDARAATAARRRLIRARRALSEASRVQSATAMRDKNWDEFSQVLGPYLRRYYRAVAAEHPLRWANRQARELVRRARGLRRRFL